MESPRGANCTSLFSSTGTFLSSADAASLDRTSFPIEINLSLLSSRGFTAFSLDHVAKKAFFEACSLTAPVFSAGFVFLVDDECSLTAPVFSADAVSLVDDERSLTAPVFSAGFVFLVDDERSLTAPVFSADVVSLVDECSLTAPVFSDDVVSLDDERSLTAPVFSADAVSLVDDEPTPFVVVRDGTPTEVGKFRTDE